MVLTTLIGGFSILTGNFTPAYMITFPILVPLYKKFDFDREAAFIIAQTAMSALCFIPAIILQWIYFGLQHKKRVGTFQTVAEVETTAEKKEENPNLRPKLFWVNLVIFVIALVVLGVFGIAPYFVFSVATVVTAMINYPKNFGEIFAKVGPMYLNILIMLIAINVYPIFISIGAGFGIPAVAVIAPFVCNLSLATSSTPTNSSTYTGCALTETEVQHYCTTARRRCRSRP